MAFQMTNGRKKAEQLGDQRAALKAQQIRTEVVLMLSQPGKGRIYEYEREYLKADGTTAKVGKKRNKAHQASAPGDPPAVDTGDLRSRIGVQKIKPGHYRVGTNLIYAPWLEFGTRRMKARPFMRPALEKVRHRQ